MRSIIAIGVGTALLFAGMQAVKADEATLKQQMADVEKQIAAIQKKAALEPDVKAAQEKYNSTLQAAMERIDPKTKDLLAQKQKLREELVAVKKALAK